MRLSSSHNREDVPKTARSLDTQATHEPHTPNPIFDCGRRLAPERFDP
jgi:hypothetical protein